MAVSDTAKILSIASP